MAQKPTGPSPRTAASYEDAADGVVVVVGVVVVGVVVVGVVVVGVVVVGVDVVEGGVGAVTRPLDGETASVEPPELLAVTTARTVEPSSAPASV
ncbi:MAG TPA: hypothetical protein VFM38_00655 [Candidatus Limnocylindrales bacterium]|nr:hypothetical protein [Candidatus Limnocylindrales bacterium]